MPTVLQLCARTAMLVAAAVPLASPAPAQTAAGQTRTGIIGTDVRAVTQGVLGLVGFAVVPDGTASAIQIDRGGRDGEGQRITLGQIGAGFTVSQSFPLYLEGYIGYSRYDPLFVFSDGAAERRIPTRWNSVAGTVGIGWDFRLAENLYLRPIVNLSLAHVSSDAALIERLVELQTDRDLDFLDRGRLNAWGAGGSLVLAWYDHTPAREIDVELRGTHIRLSTFADTSAAVRGTSDALTVNLWARMRWPTGVEAFGRPVRWVIEGQHSHFLSDQRDALGFEYLSKVGGGVEVDLGAKQFGAVGLYLQRLRLVGRYVFGEGVSGFSVGLGVSF